MSNVSKARIIYDYFLEHWILSALLATLPAYWFVLLKLAGSTLHLSDKDGLTIAGNLITWPIFCTAIFFALCKHGADRYDKNVKQRGAFIYQRLLDCANDVTAKKVQRFREFIDDHHQENNLAPFKEITKPQVQLLSLFDNIQIALAQIFGIEREHVGVSVIYKLSGNNWSLIQKNTEHDLPLQNVISDPHSTIHTILTGGRDSVFHASKIVAEQNGQYVMSEKDHAAGRIGSILCRDVSIGPATRRLKAILTITTYGKQVCSSGDADAERKIQTLIVDTFEKRVTLEMALLFLKEEISPKCLVCTGCTGDQQCSDSLECSAINHAEST